MADGLLQLWGHSRVRNLSLGRRSQEKHIPDKEHWGAYTALTPVVQSSAIQCKSPATLLCKYIGLFLWSIFDDIQIVIALYYNMFILICHPLPMGKQ